MAAPDTRQAILDAALSLFAERGFHGTAVPILAERAGIATGTLYRHFEGKEDLVNQLYRELKTSLSSHVAEGLSRRTPPRERFHAFWSRTLAWAREHPEGYAFLEFHAHAGYLDAASRKLQRQALRAGLSLIEDAQRRGTFKPGPPAVLVALMMGALSAVVRAHWDGHLELDAASAALAEEACWDAITRRG